MPDHTEVPDIAISIMQPWAWCIVDVLQKPVENRDWKPTNPGLRFRGPVAIHAGLRFDGAALWSLRNREHPVTGEALGLDPWELASFTAMSIGEKNGGIVGVAEVVDVVDQHDSPWFVGPIALVIRGARPVPFIPVSGALGFFRWRERLAA